MTRFNNQLRSPNIAALVYELFTCLFTFLLFMVEFQYLTECDIKCGLELLEQIGYQFVRSFHSVAYYFIFYINYVVSFVLIKLFINKVKLFH